ncbi:MAG: hypothetical protein RLP44_02495 [Aggregatilineales bacterium]
MAVTDTTAGFRLYGRIGGNSDNLLIQTMIFKDDETLHKGDILNAEAGEVDLGVAADTALLGIALENKTGVDSTTEIEVCVDPLAIYAVYDANARVIGATLDLTGATGAQGVTTSSEATLIVIANSAADELTLVRIHPDHHALA